MRPEPDTLVGLLHQAARLHGTKPALSERHDLRIRTWSYEALLRRVNGLARYLAQDHSLKPATRVMICASNGVHTAAAHLAAMQAGLTVVPMDLGASPDFMRRVAVQTEARLLLGGAETPRIGELPFADLKALSPGCDETRPKRLPSPSDIAQIVFTSGTTGEPKGTMLSHENIVANVKSASGIVPAEIPMNLLSILPLSHMLEQTVGLYLPVLLGGSVHYGSSLQPAILLRDMRRSRPNGMVVVPRILELLLQSIEDRIRAEGHEAQWERRLELASRLPIGLRPLMFGGLHRRLGGRLRFLLCGGASLPAELGQRWENLGIRVIEGYGATECSPVIASNTYRHRRPGSVGRPVAGVEVKLSDEGEMWVRGSNVSNGYWRNPERTALSFAPDGWFRTGDIAEQDADGTYRITARLNDRIVLASGQKVYSADIEAELTHENGIAECAVIGLTDGSRHEHVHAVMRVASGRDAQATALAAVRSANARLGSHQRILGHTIWTAGNLPRTSLGKLKRKELRDALQAGKSAGSASPPPTPGEDALFMILKAVSRKKPAEIEPRLELSDDLGIDSLGRVELVAAIESRLGITLDEAKVAELRTVGELKELVACGTKTSDAGPPASWPLQAWAQGLRTALQSVVLFPLHALWCRPFNLDDCDVLHDVTGPVLMVANHSSHADTLSLLRSMPPKLRARTAVAAASDYFYRDRMGGTLASLLLNTFPFSRSGNIRASLERCGELADEGWSILIFPEGTRSPDGRLLPFKSGIGLLARGLHVPVIPLAVEGGATVLPKGAAWPRRGSVSVRVGRPIAEIPDVATDEIALRLEHAVAGLMKGTQEHGT